MGEFSEYVKYIRYGIYILFGSGLIFEISPIKINPISAILGWLGNKLNRDVEEKITKLESKVDTVQLDLQDHKVESWRRDILDFSDSLMRGDDKTKEQFNYIIKIHDRYDKYINERNIENGQINLAYDYIAKKYQECCDNNSFYTGK